MPIPLCTSMSFVFIIDVFLLADVKFEAHQCADVLTKLGANSLSSFVVFYKPPMVESILAFDKANMHSNRLVNSYCMK